MNTVTTKRPLTLARVVDMVKEVVKHQRTISSKQDQEDRRAMLALGEGQMSIWRQVQQAA